MDNVRHIHPRRIWLFTGLFALPLCVMGLLLLLPTLSAHAAFSPTRGCKELGQITIVREDTKGQKTTQVCIAGDAKGPKTTGMCIVGAKGPGVPGPVGAKGQGTYGTQQGAKGPGASGTFTGPGAKGPGSPTFTGPGVSGTFTGPDVKGQKITCTVQEAK
jgi:hypothetical protein